jgi:hypothetical protein
MPSSIYRFRPAEALLDRFHELERQEIYFAPPAELNDPYDGAVQVQWSGDAILWKNLLNHYLLCLTRAMIGAALAPDDAELLNRGIVLPSDSALPSPEAHTLFQQAKTRFFAQASVARLPNLLAARAQPVSRNELCIYLRALHSHAVQLVRSVMKDLHLIHSPSIPDPSQSLENAAAQCCRALEAMKKEEAVGAERERFGHVFGGISESLFYQQSLLLLLNGHMAFAKNPALLSVMTDFPGRYASELETLLYSDWFTACFVEEATNAAMWGVYGNSHKGVALKFRTVEVDGRPALLLNRITSVSGGKGHTPRTGRSDVPHILEPVNYQQGFPSIEFFQNLARITVGEARFWHYDETGNRSDASAVAGFDTDAWRKRYWSNLRSALTTKHADWQHERERRIILHDGFVDFRSSKENRKLIYRFVDLEGVVFGSKTPVTQVMEIIRLVRKKCRSAGRKTFEFSRAEFCPQEGKITLVPLTQLRVD